ncbi:hypothetical protein [Pararobbsia alpina]|uniref:Uncharacterized protein n=1 Tax=Pararobbsia alpina TaxID=621374 RepID=A0A6S7B1H1_9BURK|nr:hypothetical protein [Pararobbsia alpina]CAB3784704.1 hypothetical protein LMG28138_01862 [Pararobbsia alpina]
MKRKPSDIRPAAERYADKVELALVEKFNRSQECAGQWVSEEIDWAMEMLDEGAPADRTAHELFMKRAEI